MVSRKVGHEAAGSVRHGERGDAEREQQGVVDEIRHKKGPPCIRAEPPRHARGTDRGKQ